MKTLVYQCTCVVLQLLIESRMETNTHETSKGTVTVSDQSTILNANDIHNVWLFLRYMFVCFAAVLHTSYMIHFALMFISVHFCVDHLSVCKWI